jgi:dipeptidyl aminopeptidase/acylaminoacyl peptidase
VTDTETKARVAPHGAWRSPITTELVVAETVGLGQTAIDGTQTYWTELRPSEGGRTVLVARGPEGEARDVTPEGFDVRSRVHEYGGGAFVVRDGVVYFSNDGDRRVYRQRPGEAPAPITPEGPHRYADFAIDPRRGHLFCVREDHDAAPEPRNEIVRLDPEAPGPGEVVATGADFYAAPRPSPDGAALAFVSWDHPNMPWDHTALHVVPLAEDGTPGAPRRVAGDAESIFQPAWSPDGTLHFVSDRSGWWNLYRVRAGEVEPVIRMAAEIGRPHWMFGMSTYGFAADGSILLTHGDQGRWRLARWSAGSEAPEPIALPFTQIDGLSVAGDRAVFVGGVATEPSAVVSVTVPSGPPRILRRASAARVDPSYLSEPAPVTFPTGDGAEAHAFYYPPRNPDFRAPEGEAPPLIVIGHGGPTGATSSALRWGIQYWTSRGFAVVDVNYRGSTGYGRAYRNALRGRWGLVDVEDCRSAARHLVEQGLADPDRLAIRGGSAGGYTTLQALATSDTFSAGASHFGVSDLSALAEHTHKFESRYLDSLVGPYPEAAETYRARSPLRNADRLSAPVIFFQGLEDRIVPPEQSERMAAALRDKGIPVAYVAFEGEQHGFRRAENIRRALEGELYFYGRIFGFEPADAIDPVPIDNLDG